MKSIVYRKIYENELNHAWYIGTRNLLLKNLNSNIKKEAKILDAGCGTGGAIKFLNKNNFKNTYGIDFSDQSIKFCKLNKLKNISKGSVNKLPYKNNYFDAVICLDVLYHEGVEPKKALEEFYRVLKKGGLLYLQEPAFNLFKSGHDIAIKTARRFTKQELRELVESSKFKVGTLSYFNVFFFLPILIKRLAENKLKSKKLFCFPEKADLLLVWG